jgi:hypothetical protein
MIFRYKVYKGGDYRARKHFCFLPLWFEGTCYWLEKVLLVEKYDTFCGFILKAVQRKRKI